jgi:hypothetical protein
MESRFNESNYLMTFELDYKNLYYLKSRTNMQDIISSEMIKGGCDLQTDIKGESLQ